jgi:hypothetical protein
MVAGNDYFNISSLTRARLKLVSKKHEVKKKPGSAQGPMGRTRHSYAFLAIGGLSAPTNRYLSAFMRIVIKSQRIKVQI